MKRTLLFLFCALMSTQMFSETLFGYLFPTLAYLERTSCHYMEGNEQNRTLNRLSFEDNMFEIDGNYYIEYNDLWLREDKEGRIFVYSEPAKKDLVLYDFTLEVGDTLTTLNIDIVPMTEGDPILPGVKPVVVDYPIHLDEYVSFPIDTLIVTDVSMVMMCDSNQYKKWTFSNGMEYMEYIGNLGADFFAIIRNPWEELPTCCVEEDLVCASIYDRLVYLMDDEKRDLLNIDCPCTSWSNKWQWRTNTWNVLQFDGMAFEQTAQTWQYELAHDTIIGGKEYTAVTRHWTAYDESAAEYVAAVRFAENKKAYIYYDNAEYLLYDFGYHEIGDTLEVFSGINNYMHFKTYKCVIVGNDYTNGGIAEDTYVMDIIHPITGGTIPSALVWQEFVGSYSGFLYGGLLVPGSSNYQLLCAYKDNALAYSVDNDAFTDNDTFIEYGCEYNANDVNNNFNEPLIGQWRGVDRDLIVSISDSIISIEKIGLSHKYIASATQLQIERLWAQEDAPHRSANCDYWLHGDTLWIDSIVPSLAEIYPPIFGSITLVRVKNEELFPTLAGLQRTHTIEMYDHAPNDGKRSGGYPLPFASVKDTVINGKTYLQFGDYVNGSNYSLFFLREENNKVLIYSSILQNDLVLYDYTLELGDSLPAITSDHDYFSDDHFTKLNKAENIFTYVVTDVSTVTLLDGIERKKWILKNKYLPIIEYVEGIGCYGENTSHSGDFFRLIEDHPYTTESVGDHLVCVSKNGQLLYKMDDAEMEQLETECLCEGETSYKSQWCDTWNVFVENGSVYPPYEETYRYQLAKDTVIGGYTYTAVVSKAINDALDAPHYVAAVRFTDDRKVYIYYDNAEYLLYDFNVQQGDELEVFAGINNYRFGIKTYKCIVTGVEQYACIGCPATITLHVPNHPDDFTEIYRRTQWQEGVGDVYSGFLNGVNGYVPADGDGSVHLLCAYQGDELKYTGDLYEEYGCGDDAEQTPEDLFPTLWGLQRTTFYHYTDCSESASSLTVSNEIVTINDKPYLRFGDLFLREENNRVLIYSEAYDKDLVLYDWNLEVGDSVTLLAFDFGFYPEDAASVVDYRVIVDIDDNGDLVMDTIPTDKVVVDKISTITLLDGKEYKMWHLATGWAGGITYVEGIGIFGEGYFEGDYFGLIQIEELPTCYYGDLLVCITRNGQLLYQMDDTEMERLGAECLCEYNDGPKKDNAKDGKIGGRPTPTQWNMLEMVVREMENNKTILQAETFSYTLEDNSRILNNKTYFDLARQSTRDTAITKSVVGALHFNEDEGNRVYFLCDGTEYLLYDFTAEPGDSIEIFAGINNYPQATTYTHVVTGKDTLENGACRMILEVVFPNQTGGTNLQKVWLAGLGSLDGIVHNSAQRASNARSAETESSVMLCAWREDSCLYTTDHPDFINVGCEYNHDYTAVEDVHTSGTQYKKIIRDGHLYIIYNGGIYNVLGINIAR